MVADGKDWSKTLSTLFPCPMKKFKSRISSPSSYEIQSTYILNKAFNHIFSFTKIKFTFLPFQWFLPIQLSELVFLDFFLRSPLFPLELISEGEKLSIQHALTLWIFNLLNNFNVKDVRVKILYSTDFLKTYMHVAVR